MVMVSFFYFAVEDIPNAIILRAKNRLIYFKSKKIEVELKRQFTQ
jgi:hypothetical protein